MPIKLYRPPTAPPHPRLRHGDVLFFYGRDLISRIIEVATRGPSHVAIVCEHQGRQLIVESTTLCPWDCVITGKRIDGVQAHYWQDRIATYPGRVDRLRLLPHWELTAEESALMSHLLIDHWIGRPYDLRGALISGTKFLKLTRWVRYPDLGSQFCSELVAAVLMRLGRLPLGNAQIYNPASLVRALRRCGTYAAPVTIHE